MERIILVWTGPTSWICYRNCCSLWRTLVKICKNLASICEYKTVHLSFFMHLYSTIQVDEFIMIWWMSASLPFFFWWFLFYFSFCCVFIWHESNARWPGSGLSNRNVAFPPAIRHLECRKFQTGIFVAWNAVALHIWFTPWVTSHKRKQEWLCSWAVVVSAQIVANRGINWHLLLVDNQTQFKQAKRFAWLCIFHLFDSLSAKHL